MRWIIIYLLRRYDATSTLPVSVSLTISLLFTTTSINLLNLHLVGTGTVAWRSLNTPRSSLSVSIDVKAMTKQELYLGFQPASKTIIDGEVYDCKPDSKVLFFPMKHSQGRDGCPNGTYPISSPNQFVFRGRHCSAVVRTVAPNQKYLGASAEISIHKPHVYSDAQWSTSRVKLQNGPDSIEAGSMVYPDLYKDNETHFYAKFKAGPKGCTNTQCKGFVQVSTEVHLGEIFTAYSKVVGVSKINIDKHPDDGKWWLSIGTDRKVVGYWPKTLFTALGDFAEQVEWGGEIDHPRPTLLPPDMGNGQEVEYDTRRSAHFRHISFINQSFQSVVNPPNTKKFMDCDPIYTVLDGGYHGRDLGRLIFYGGGALVW